MTQAAPSLFHAGRHLQQRSALGAHRLRNEEHHVSQQKHGQRLVQVGCVVGPEEDECQRHHDARQRKSGIGQAFQQLTEAVLLAHGQDGDGQGGDHGQQRRQQRGGERIPGRPDQCQQVLHIAGRRPNLLHQEILLPAAPEPVAQSAHRHDQGQENHGARKEQRGPFPAAQPHNGRLAGHADGETRVAGPAAGAVLQIKHQPGQQDEHHGQAGGHIQPIGEVAVIDDAREGAVLEQRHRAEVPQGVQRHQQGAGGDGGFQVGQRHPAKSRPESPRLRAASSSAGSMRLRAARTVRKMYG